MNYEDFLKSKKILTIVVKQFWFDKIANREKLEDFRDIKTYWNSRFLLPQFKFLSTDSLFFPPVFENG